MDNTNTSNGSSSPHLTQEFLEEMKEALVQEQHRLEEDLKGLTEHNELGSDYDSQVQEVEEDQVSQDIIAAMKSDLEKIQKALGKIEAGSYGTDDEGKQISEARLRALPWADKAI